MDVTFKQLAVSAISRSARGVVALILRDDTNKTFTTVEYKSAADIEVAKFTATNFQYITDCFLGVPSKVIVIRIDVAGLIADALTIAAGLKFNYIGEAAGIAADQTAIVTWIKTQETNKKTFKAVVFNATAPDCKHIINFSNTSVTFTDVRGLQTGEKYVATLLGIFAGLPLDMSSTFFKCTNLKSVVEPADVDAAINLGCLVLFNDDGFVKIGSGVNSLVTITTTNTADMKQIGIVEAMDLIIEDIRSTFKNDFVGNYKNKYDNQVLLISSINSYFNDLEIEEVLDNDYNNSVVIDIAAQNLAWQSIGKDTSTWSDQTVRNNSYKTTVFLAGNIKILGAIENLSFSISMF
jgi:hypothetical protein